jgi:hypothetical protein
MVRADIYPEFRELTNRLMARDMGHEYVARSAMPCATFRRCALRPSLSDIGDIQHDGMTHDLSKIRAI